MLDYINSDGVPTSVPEVKDLQAERDAYIRANQEEPVFLLNPLTFRMFVKYLQEVEGIDPPKALHSDFGEGLNLAKVLGAPAAVTMFPDPQVDEGTIETFREREFDQA